MMAGLEPSVVGSLPKPAWLAEPSSLKAPWRLHGEELQTAQDDAVLGAGSANIIGSMVSRGDFSRTGNGNISIIYDNNQFGGTGPPTGLLVPVPGSWRDKATPY